MPWHQVIAIDSSTDQCTRIVGWESGMETTFQCFFSSADSHAPSFVLLCLMCWRLHAHACAPDKSNSTPSGWRWVKRKAAAAASSKQLDKLVLFLATKERKNSPLVRLFLLLLLVSAAPSSSSWLYHLTPLERHLLVVDDHFLANNNTKKMSAFRSIIFYHQKNSEQGRCRAAGRLQSSVASNTMNSAQVNELRINPTWDFKAPLLQHSIQSLTSLTVP